MILLVYVDDIILAGNDSIRCTHFKSYLQGCFQIKDLGPLNYFLGIEVTRSAAGIFVNQQRYALEIIREHGLEDAKPAQTPIPQQHGLSSEIGDLLTDAGLYRRLIGRLIYLTNTRPDISYSVQVLSQFMQAPRVPHLNMAYCVLHYIKHTCSQGITFSKNNSLTLRAYSDSDWATCPTTRRSISGMIILMGDSPISWKSKKQQTVSLSSAEAEYRALAITTVELVWLRNLLKDMSHIVTDPITLYCDNQSAIHIATNPVFHERTKHIELDCHFIKEHVQKRLLQLQFVPSHNQLADLLTKGLSHKVFQSLL